MVDHERVLAGDASEPPPSADLIEGAGPVRRSRSVIGMAMLAGLALVGFLVTRPTGHATAPAPSPTPEPIPDLAVAQVAFTDADHGYLVLSPCQLTTTCRGPASLLRTSDAGRHWHEVASPLDVHDTEQVAVYARGRRDVALMIDGARFVSSDAGRTWREAPPVTTAGPTGTVRDGDLIGYYCPFAMPRPDCSTRLSVFDPVTGTSRPLRNQPPITGGPDHQVFALAAAGQVWVLDTPPSGTPRLVHSPDHGGHWRAVPVPVRSDWFQPQLLLAPDASRLYLVNRDVHSSRILEVLRLVDPAAGRWVLARPPQGAQDATVMPNGELRYNDIAGNAWLTVTTGLATAVTSAPKALMDGRRVNVNLDQVVDGVLVATPVLGLRGDRILISTDNARHWQVHPVDP